MRYPAALTATLALIGSLAACTGARAEPDVSASAQRASTVGVTVENDNSLTMTVYRVRSGTRFRLGTVTAFDTETFQVSEDALSAGTMQLLVDPIGSDEVFVTPAISVGTGQRIVLKVASQLGMSTHAVWNAPPAQ